MAVAVPPATNDFHSPVHAAEHLCDHVLTRPEAHDWPLVLPGYPSRLKPTDDAHLEALGRSLFGRTPAPKARQLLELYRQALRQAIDDALRLGWWWEEQTGRYSKWLGYSPSGIFVVWDRRVIQTGFLFRGVSWPCRCKKPRHIKPLPRRRSSRPMPPAPWVNLRSRYLLFCDNLQFVRAEYAAAYFRGEVGPDAGPGAAIFVSSGPPDQQVWQRL